MSRTYACVHEYSHFLHLLSSLSDGFCSKHSPQLCALFNPLQMVLASQLCSLVSSIFFMNMTHMLVQMNALFFFFSKMISLLAIEMNVMEFTLIEYLWNEEVWYNERTICKDMDCNNW